jgi:hypothetical protein
MTGPEHGSREEETGPPINPWEGRLHDQGFNFDIPPRFINLHGLPREVTTDTLVGLPVEDDKMRLFLADRLSHNVRDGKGWARIYIDGDNVKRANHEQSRRFGDMVIKYGAATGTQLADGLAFPEDVEMYATRQTQAADETVISIFSLTPEQERAVEEAFSTDSSKQSENPSFTFSVTTAIITSSEPRIQDELRATETFLQNNPNKIGRNLFREIDNLLENDVNVLKAAKDLDRLAEGELTEAETLSEFTDAVTEKIGGGRIMRETLETLLAMNAVRTISELGRILPAHQYFKLLESLDVTPTEINQAKTPEDQQRLYYQIFPDPSSN